MLALVYQDAPMLAASCHGRLALVYPNTLMLAFHFPHSCKYPPPPPIFEKNHGEKQEEIGRENSEIERKK